MQLLPILDMNYQDLQKQLETIQEKKYRIDQIWYWFYKRGIFDFTKMNNIAKKSQEKLAQYFSVDLPQVAKKHVSQDGTIKYIIKFDDEAEVETVFIPEDNRGTICVSSQIGCTLSCKFCHTGTQLCVRNLKMSEIITQIIIVKNDLNDWNKNTQHKKVTNVVFMGMGEPMYNYDNVVNACKILIEPKAIAIAAKKITISTSGIVPTIDKLGKDVKVSLAISLHATTDEVRSNIMSINKKYPLKELLNSCQNYHGVDNNRHRITFEYVMLKNINDTNEDAHRLVKILQNIPAKINIIPFNPWKGSIYQCSNMKRIKEFANIISNKKMICTIRKTRGDDVYAACGQLKSDTQKKSKKIIKNQYNNNDNLTTTNTSA